MPPALTQPVFLNLWGSTTSLPQMTPSCGSVPKESTVCDPKELSEASASHETMQKTVIFLDILNGEYLVSLHSTP